MLRRMKTDVNLSLPPKKEILVFTPLTTMQSDLYMQILNRTFHEQLRKERVGLSIIFVNSVVDTKVFILLGERRHQEEERGGLEGRPSGFGSTPAQ